MSIPVAEIVVFNLPFGWKKEENILPCSKPAVQGGRFQISIGKSNLEGNTWEGKLTQKPFYAVDYLVRK